MGRCAVLAVIFLAACATAPRPPVAPTSLPRAPLAAIAWPDDSPAVQLAVLNRVSWGANRTSYGDVARDGSGRWLDTQLRPVAMALPAEAQAAIDAMSISQRTLADIGAELDEMRRAFQNA